MEQLPEFWRTEVWHPLSVHFPIVLLLLATLFFIITMIKKKPQNDTWFQISGYLLYAGVLTAWLAVYTGAMADGIVSRKICDPTVLKDHENATYTLSYLFSIAALLHLVVTFNILRNFKKWLCVAILVLLISGSGVLAYAGHLGATLVYQQGAGVYHPSEDCVEFTE